jgi:hypothetical protein
MADFEGHSGPGKGKRGIPVGPNQEGRHNNGIYRGQMLHLSLLTEEKYYVPEKDRIFSHYSIPLTR